MNDPLIALSKEVAFLRQIIFQQAARIEALQDFSVALAVRVGGADGTKACSELRRIEMVKYDKIILDLGDRYPDVAENIDVRKSFPPEERQKWMFPEGS